MQLLPYFMSYFFKTRIENIAKGFNLDGMEEIRGNYNYTNYICSSLVRSSYGD